MLLPLTIAFVSVALGVALGLGRERARHALGPVRTFALVAAVATVALELVPGAGERGGAPALAVFVAAAFGPWLLERLGGRWGAARSPAARLEVGYLALLVHHVGDGLGLGVYTGAGHEGHVHWDVVLSIGGHTVPVTAVVVLAFARRASRYAAALRGFGFAFAIALGIALSGVGSAAAFERVEPYLTAAVAGLLLHVATHDWLEDPPLGSGTKLLDLLAAGLGLALVTVSLGSHEHHGGDAHGDASVGAGALALALRFSPPLLAAAVLAAFLSRSAPPRIAPGEGFFPTLRAAVLGATVGEGALRVPTAGPAADAASLAFALGRAGLGLGALALAANAFGPGFAGAWIAGGALLIAVFAWSCRRGSTVSPPSGGAPVEEARTPRARGWQRFFDGLEGAFAANAAPAGLGIVVAAALAMLLRDGALATLSLRRLDVLLLPLTALVLRAPPVALVAPLLVLVDKGANAPAALAALAVSAAVAPLSPTLALERPRGGLRSLALVILAASAGALALTFAGWPPSPIRTRPSVDVDPVDLLCATVLAGLALSGAWRRGVRAWMAIGLGRGGHQHDICFEESASDGHDHGHSDHRHSAHVHSDHGDSDHGHGEDPSTRDRAPTGEGAPP